MRQVKGQYPGYRFTPLLKALIRYSKDYIGIYVLKPMFLSEDYSLRKVIEAMNTAKLFEKSFLTSLKTHTESVYTCSAIGRKLFTRQGARIGLQGAFAILYHMIMAMNGIQNPLYMIMGYKGGCSATDKDGLYF